MIALGAAGVGLALSALGAWLDPARFLHAWLAAVAAWLGWPLGSLALLLVHALTGGRWGEALRPALLAGVSTLPLLLPAMLPLWLGFGQLYPWAHEEVANAFYLDVPFYAGRCALYGAVWFLLGAIVWRRSERLAGIAAPGLLALAVTITFASIDMTMSLDPGFDSSIYGMIAVASAALLALAVAARRTAWTASRKTLADIEKLLLGLVILWAYLAFMQFLIVWESDLADEAAWYALRGRGVWAWMSGAVALLHFALPLVLLAIPVVRRSRLGAAAIATLLVAIEVVRFWWLVLPAGGHAPGWLEAAAVAALFGAAAVMAGRVPAGRVVHV